MSFFYPGCVGCLVWWMSGVVDVRCGGCLMWWMSYLMDGVVDVWCGGCLVWWMSFFAHGVVDVWCGGCLCGGCRTIVFLVISLNQDHTEVMIHDLCMTHVDGHGDGSDTNDGHGGGVDDDDGHCGVVDNDDGHSNDVDNGNCVDNDDNGHGDGGDNDDGHVMVVMLIMVFRRWLVRESNPIQANALRIFNTVIIIIIIIITIVTINLERYKKSVSV